MNAQGQCTYTSSPDAAALFAGTFDIGLTDTYSLALLLQGTDTTESASVSGAHVVIHRGDEIISDREVVGTGFVPAGGYGLSSLTVIDAVAADALRKPLVNRTASSDLVVDVEVQGSDPATGVGTSTPVFHMPVKACVGCLVDFSQGNDFLQRPNPNCLKYVSPQPRRPCLPGQDEAMPCTLCIGSNPVCDPQTP